MTTTYVCPKGDQSDDPEFCSVCGAKIDAAVAVAAPSPSSTPGSERCPTCGMPRTPSARFCETCRYDFKAAEEAPAAQPPLTTTPPDPTPIPAAPPATTRTTSWEAVITVDPALDLEPDPETPCPTNAPERTFPLDLPENLVGRRSANRGIFPQISLDDPGVSHRHLMIYRDSNNPLQVSDLGSTNGTFLNNSTDRLEPGVKTTLTDGDSIELGRWTRITFHQRMP